MKFTILMALVAGVVAEGETSHQKVSVYVLDNAEVPSEVRYAAQGLATQMFARIGVNVEWSLRRPTPQSSDRGIVVELTAKTPQTFPPATLAYAKPYEGVHVSIFYDRMKGGESICNTVPAGPRAGPRDRAHSPGSMLAF